MEIKQAIGILETKRLFHCSDKDYSEALRMAIDALKNQADQEQRKGDNLS